MFWGSWGGRCQLAWLVAEHHLSPGPCVSAELSHGPLWVPTKSPRPSFWIEGEDKNAPPADPGPPDWGVSHVTMWVWWLAAAGTWGPGRTLWGVGRGVGRMALSLWWLLHRKYIWAQLLWHGQWPGTKGVFFSRPASVCARTSLTDPTSPVGWRSVSFSLFAGSPARLLTDLT